MAKKPARLQLGVRRVDELRPNPKNVKTHPLGQIMQLRASIQKFGFRDPIGIKPDGEILEGHGRWEAAKMEGIEEVPVLIIAGLSDREARAYAIAHNQTTANTGLDMAVVKDEVNRLGVGEDEFMSIGLTPDDLFFADMGGDANEYDFHGNRKEQSGAAPSKALSTTLKFDNTDQYATWQQFIEASRTRYDGMTIADRLMQFLSEFDHAS